MSKWLDWYNTPDGKAYYDKYIANIPGIEADENTIKNAYYEWVNATYKAQDGIINTIKNTSNIVKVIAFFITIFFILKFKKVIK